MYRQPLRLAAEAAWGDHPYGRSTLGTETTVRALSPEKLATWHAARVRESAAVLVAVGDLDPQELADLLASRFAELRGAPAPDVPPPAWPRVAAERVEQRDKAQTALALLFPGPTRGETARFDAAMIGGIASGLGGRLFEELRSRRSLAYTVLCRPFVRQRAGAFAAYIATSPGREEEARVGLLTELARFTETPVTEDELSRARQYAVGAWQIRQASGAAVMGDLAEAWVHGHLGELARYPDDLAAVTPARLLEAARRWIDPERRVEGVVRGRAPAAG
jgi:zinc protease